MNINTIRSGDPIEAVSPLKSHLKQPQEKHEGVKTGLNNRPDQSEETGKQLRTEQNRQLSNDTTLQGKQKEDEKQKNASLTEAKQMVDELNDYMDELQTSLGFSVTQDPENQIIFQIKDRKTNEVIRQIPTEEIQKIKEKMNELTGLLLDQHA